MVSEHIEQREGVYYVTGGGQQAVTARFQDNPRRRAAKARNRAAKKKGKST